MREKEPSYDLFISYADADRAWVEGYLLDALTRAGARCHSDAAFALGVPRLLEFERAIQQSQRTLLVLSPAYLAEGFGQFTDLLAQSYGLETATWPVIPLILHPVELPPRLAMLITLDATDADQWAAVADRLCAELQRPVPGPAPKPACPYPGMVPFSEADSERFFGRDREVQELLERLRLHPFLTAIGPSGSGKSSLVFAGLIPALRRTGLFGVGGWMVRTVRPGEAPLTALAIAVRGDPADPGRVVPELLATQPDARHLLLVVDQFEELFTLSRSDVEPFQETLLQLAETPSCYVVLTVRADFYPDLMAGPMWEEIQAHRAEVLPLDDEGLRQAILRPAEDVGVFVEAALVERLLADAAGEPGILPLVQETLVLLWERLERRLLPLRAYEALVLPRAAYGAPERTGLQVAMARRADVALADLGLEQQAIARRVFLRLVQFGEGRADTRRQQPVDALRAAGDDVRLFGQTLHHLADHRLLTLSGEQESAERKADIAHEALIGGWPTLQGWVAERREAEQTRRRLEDKAAEWVRLGRGSGGLLDEVELLEAERWLASPDAADLGYSEALPSLAEASRTAIEEAEREKEAARQRELQQERALAEEQRKRAEQQAKAAKQLGQRFRMAVAFALIAIVAAIAAVYGLDRANKSAAAEASARVEAEARRVEAVNAQATGEVRRVEAVNAQATGEARRVEAVNAQATAEAERDRAEQQTRLARSGQLAAQALAALEWFPQRSLLLAVEALNITMQAGEPRALSAEDALWQALASPGGRVLRGHTSYIGAVAISPDSRWLVTGSDDHTARLWDLTAPDPDAAPIVLRGHESGITAVAISPDNRWLVTGSHDHTARLWDLTTPNVAAAPIVLPGGGGPAVAISPDSRWLVTGSWDGTARLWDLTTPNVAAAPIVLPGGGGPAVAISPDSRWLVTGSWDGTARLWDLTAPDPAAAATVLRGHTGDIEAVAISPDNHWLVTGGRDATARLWDLTAADPAAAPILLPGHEGYVWAVAISPDKHWLVTAGGLDGPGTACLWDLRDLTAANPAATPIVLRGHEDLIRAVAISPDSHWLVTGGRDATARLWDLTTPNVAAAPIVLRAHTSAIGAVAISPDNHWLVTSSQDATARLWDLTTPNVAAAPIVLRGHQDTIDAVAISPDSRWLVTSSWRPTARLWDLTYRDPAAAPIVLSGHELGITAVAISTDNHWLVTGSGDGTAHLRDLSAADPAAGPIVLRGHTSGIEAVAISPDNHWLVTGSGDHTARLWDLTAPNPAAAPIVLSGHTSDIGEVAISPDNHWLVTGSGDGTARLWDLTAPDPTAEPIVLSGHEGDIYALAISPGNHWLVTGSWDATARLWDLTASNPAAAATVLPHGEGPIGAVAISTDNHWLVTLGWRTARLWDLTAADPAAAPIVLSGHEGTPNAILAMAISPDNHWLVTGGRDTTARLWDLTAADPAAAPIVLSGHTSDIGEVAISPDNHWLVTGSGDNTARLWDLTAANPAAAPIVLSGHEGDIYALAISPDNHWLVTGSGDGTAHLWNLRLDELVELACRTSGRNLTRKEWEQYFPGQDYRKTCEQWPLEPEWK